MAATPALRSALDCLVAASVPGRGRLDATELAHGFRALMLAISAHGALRQARGQRPYTLALWLREIDQHRGSGTLWPILLELLEQDSRDLPAPLQTLLDPVPLRELVERKTVTLEDGRLPEFLGLLLSAAGSAADDPFGSLVSQLEVLGSIHELFLDLQLAGGTKGHKLHLTSNILRRRSGSHFTPSALCRLVAERTLEPLLRRKGSEALLALRICDPAMGTGAFLIHSCDLIARALLREWKREEHALAAKHSHGAQALRLARRAVVEQCLYGVDRDQQAVSLARASLMLCGDLSDRFALDLSKKLRHGDAVVGQPCSDSDHALASLHAFHWPLEFPEIFPEPATGFDAMVGNPPWVAYVGRAAQPLDPKVARYYLENNPAFRSYRTLHGLFVYRAAQLLKPGGRLGLLIPTSVADLDGYAPTRASLDALCTVDELLPDFGDGRFAGVFQPCIALHASRRDTAVPGSTAPWNLSRDDLDPEAAALLQRLAALPPLPPELFGERGFQTTGTDRNFLRRQSAAQGQFTLPLAEGIDVREFIAAEPTLYAAPKALLGKLRRDADWKSVAIWIRQTARYPIAALARGIPFRNSILAGFSSERYSASFLLCYLNSDVVRWYHFMSRRDARQGMPQLKIGHLRRLPAPQSTRAIRELASLGQKLGAKRAPTASERKKMNTWACDALGLGAPERVLVTNWAIKNPLPKSRRA